MANLISAVLSPEDIIEINGLLDSLEAKFNFNIGISPDQLADVPKLADGRLPFVQDGLILGKQEPRIVPPFTDLNEYDKDLTLFSVLGPFETRILKLGKILTAARYAAGSDAFRTARQIYSSAQKAAAEGVPGMQAIVDQLKPLFEGQGVKKE